jgi:hypothetical protein
MAKHIRCSKRFGGGTESKPSPQGKKRDQFAINLLPNTVQLHQLWYNKNTDEPTS